jgi:hypothetical protein
MIDYDPDKHNPDGRTNIHWITISQLVKLSASRLNKNTSISNM